MTENIYNGTRGPRDARVLIVGEAFGEHERQQNKPFVGASGALLEEMLTLAGISPSECLFANCIAKKPYGNEMKNFLIKNEKGKKDKYDPRWLKGVKCGDLLREGLHTLDKIISETEPDIIITAGNWPLWWLTDHLDTKTQAGYKMPYGVDSWRGSQLYTSENETRRGGIPLLPIWHPASTLRVYKQKITTVQDLRRAKKYLTKEEPFWYDTTQRNFVLFPIAQEVVEWLEDVMLSPETPIVCDVETYNKRLHIVGLADSEYSGIVIPFFHIDEAGTHNYYSFEDYTTIMLALWRFFHSPCKLIGQNFQYDLQYIDEYFGVTPQVTWDTMIAQHVMFVNLRKGLEFLASMYCRHYVYWKEDRKESLKNEDLKKGCLYNAEDLWRTYEIFRAQSKAMKELGCKPRFDRRMQQMRSVVKMSNRGLNINEDLRQQQKAQLFQYAQELVEWLEEVVPDEAKTVSKTGTPWYQSAQQKAKVLYDNLGFKEIRKHGGSRTTEKEALATLGYKYPHFRPLFSALIVLNSISTIAGNFLSAKTDPDHRMRCTFSVARVITNRLSSSESSFGSGTNLQNIMRPRGEMDMLDQDMV